VAQLSKLADVVRSRVRTASVLTERLRGLAGITTPPVPSGDVHTFWKYSLHVDSNVVPGGPQGLGEALKEFGIVSAPGYIQKPSFMCEIFREQRTFGSSRWPFVLARPEAVDYDPAKYPGAFKGLEGILVLPWNEKYTDEHVEHIAQSLEKAVDRFAR